MLRTEWLLAGPPHEMMQPLDEDHARAHLLPPPPERPDHLRRASGGHARGARPRGYRPRVAAPAGLAAGRWAAGCARGARARAPAPAQGRRLAHVRRGGLAPAAEPRRAEPAPTVAGGRDARAAGAAACATASGAYLP